MINFQNKTSKIKFSRTKEYFYRQNSFFYALKLISNKIETIEMVQDIRKRLAENGTTAVKFGEISKYLSKRLVFYT